ncbi:7TM diverse intracellular signaling domain-containing protein [Marinobacteraceae bacterium S3BR75-40.1]
MTPLIYCIKTHGLRPWGLYVLLGLALACCSMVASADSAVRLNDGTEKLVLSAQSRFLEETGDQYPVEDVLSGKWDDRFFESDKDRANFGFEGGVYWLHTRLVYQPYRDKGPREWWIKADYPPLDKVDVYIRQADGSLETLELGDDRPGSNNAIPSPYATFRVTTPPDKPVDLYIRVDTDSSRQLGFVLYSESGFSQAMQVQGILFGGFYGIMLIMVLYNLFIYLSIRDRAYLYYVLGILCFLAAQACLDGLPWRFQLYDDPQWYDRDLPVMMNFTWIWLMQFSRHFLQTRVTAPFLDKVMRFLAIAAFWAMGLSLVVDYTASIGVAIRITVLYALILGVIGVVLWRSGNRLARYYTLAWFCYMTGVLLYIIYVFGATEYNVVVNNGIRLGAFGNVLLLSLALADRINMQKRETDYARRRALLAKQDAQAANERAQEHLRRFRQLYDNAAEGIFQCSLDGHFLSANPSLAQTFGYATPEELVESVDNIAQDCYVNPEDRFLFEKELMTQRRVVEWEAQYVRKDGSRFWGVSSAHLAYDADGNPAYLEGSLIDITERKEKEKAQREREAAQASAQAKSDFLANMSHEIRTPMNAIIGFAELAQRTDLNPKQRGYVEKIEHASRALLGIINDILDFSKIEAGKLDLERTEFNLHDVINDIMDMLAHKTAEKNLELSVNLAKGTPTALIGDPLRLGQILINLTNNAIKFTESGEIQLRISEQQTLDGRSALHFAVTDTGIGISREQLGKLFTPFTQADGSTTRKFGGTGLGLSISKQLVEMMGGEIWAESREGHGSTFQFTAWFDLQSDYETKNIYASKELKDLRVLLLDDRDAGQEALMEILTSFECQPTLMQPDYRLLERLQSEVKTPEYDLVMVDRHLAAMRTIDAALAVRQVTALAEVPIVVMALPNEEHLMEEATSCGFYPLVKPVTPSVILDSIQEIFGYTGPRTSRRFTVDERPDIHQILKNRHVLLVEDTPFNQEIAREFLRQVDIAVTVAENGVEAVEMMEKQAFDAVLMDCQMPVMDGFEATRRIRHQLRLPDLPVIAMTANAMKGDREKCLESGMNDYLSKPVAQDDLYQTLAHWIGQAEGLGEGDVEEKEIPAEPAAEEPATVQFERGRALAQLGGNEKLLDELLERFRQEQGQAVDQILEALDRNDREEAHRLAHTLKGVAASLGVQGLSQRAEAVEEALAGGAVMTQVERLLCHLDTAHQQLLSQLETLHEESL